MNNFNEIIKRNSFNSKELLPQKLYILNEEFRHTSRFQDAIRLLIVLIHAYYYIMVIKTWGLTIKICLFMTLISFYLNFNYFTLCLINSYFHNNYGNIFIKQCNLNTLFRAAFTISNVVVIMYWGIYFHDETLLGDTYLRLDFDLFLHGGNVFVLIIDRVFIDREHRFESKITKRTLFFISICYFILIYSVYLSLGISVYPLIAKLSLIQLGVLVLVSYILLLIGNFIYETLM